MHLLGAAYARGPRPMACSAASFWPSLILETWAAQMLLQVDSVLQSIPQSVLEFQRRAWDHHDLFALPFNPWNGKLALLDEAHPWSP